MPTVVVTAGCLLVMNPPNLPTSGRAALESARQIIFTIQVMTRPVIKNACSMALNGP